MGWTLSFSTNPNPRWNIMVPEESPSSCFSAPLDAQSTSVLCVTARCQALSVLTEQKKGKKGTVQREGQARALCSQLWPHRRAVLFPPCFLALWVLHSPVVHQATWEECGIDMNAWQTGGRFWGVELLLFNLVMTWGCFAFYTHAPALRSNIFSTLFLWCWHPASPIISAKHFNAHVNENIWCPEAGNFQIFCPPVSSIFCNLGLCGLLTVPLGYLTHVDALGPLPGAKEAWS